MSITRRTFSRTVGLGLVGAALPAAAQRKLNVKVGHTGITWPWGNAPRGGPGRAHQSGSHHRGRLATSRASASRASSCSAGRSRGWRSSAASGRCWRSTSSRSSRSYTGVNLTDPAQRQATIAAAVTTGKLVKKLGGTVMVIGPNGVPRNTFDFAANKANILSALNEVGTGPDRSRPHAGPAPAHRHLHRDARRDLRGHGEPSTPGT